MLVVLRQNSLVMAQRDISKGLMATTLAEVPKIGISHPFPIKILTVIVRAHLFIF